MSKYAIVRILGNENVPRDRPGSRLKVLEFILKNEPVFENTVKLFALNKLIDENFQRDIEKLFRAYGVKYGGAEFPWKTLTASQSDYSLNLAVIGINHVRNSLIDIAHQKAEYAIILDGDCIFTQQGWDAFTTTVEQYPSKYYSIPMVRIEANNYFDPIPQNYTEPMLAFHRTADMRFDPKIAFGAHDKLELLMRLGHDAEMDKNHQRITGDKTRMAGYVCHLNTGIEAVETDQLDRLIARDISLQRLYLQVRKRLKAMTGIA
jgi:hypothetical protein